MAVETLLDTKTVSPMTGARAAGPEIPPYLADLRRAESALLSAELSPGPAGRYLAAHLAAMRTAVTVLAVMARPRRSGGGSGPADVWQVLARTAPEYGEWAAFFAAGRQKWLLVQSGAYALVSEREADDLLRDAGDFYDLVSRRLAHAWRRQCQRHEGQRHEGQGQESQGQETGSA
jgi:hypothetical protein